jgi:hypothetical protein
MTPNPDADQVRAQLAIWWIIWSSILAGLVIIYVVLGRRPLPPDVATRQSLTGLAGLAPLFVSIIIRWLVLPRSRNMRVAFVMFVVGIVLAEFSGLLGIFFGGPYRDDLFILGVLGIAQFVPFFGRRFLEPKAEGFYPNN